MTKQFDENGASFGSGTPSSHDQGLTEPQLLGGLVDCYVVCSFDAVATDGVANTPCQRMPVWWLAGGTGTLTGAIWNFAMSSRLDWRSG